MGRYFRPRWAAVLETDKWKGTSMTDECTVFWRSNERAYELFQELLAAVP